MHARMHHNTRCNCNVPSRHGVAANSFTQASIAMRNEGITPPPQHTVPSCIESGNKESMETTLSLFRGTTALVTVVTDIDEGGPGASQVHKLLLRCSETLPRSIGISTCECMCDCMQCTGQCESSHADVMRGWATATCRPRRAGWERKPQLDRAHRTFSF